MTVDIALKILRNHSFLDSKIKVLINDELIEIDDMIWSGIKKNSEDEGIICTLKNKIKD